MQHRRKLETLKHISNRRTTGAQLCAPVRGLPLLPGLGLAYKSLPLKISFLEIFNRIFLLILIGSRRDPGLASEEVLASIRFYANKHFHEYWYNLISSLRIQPLSSETLFLNAQSRADYFSTALSRAMVPRGPQTTLPT